MSYFDQKSTERLHFQKVTKSHTLPWTQFFEGNENIHFLGQDPSKSPHELAAIWVERQLTRYAENERGKGHLAAYDAEGELVAMSGLIERDLDEGLWIEIAYSVMPKHWGKGYATEMARHWMQYGMENEIDKRLISLIHKDNVASKRVAEKAGLRYVRESVCKGMPAEVFQITHEEYLLWKLKQA